MHANCITMVNIYFGSHHLIETAILAANTNIEQAKRSRCFSYGKLLKWNTHYTYEPLLNQNSMHTRLRNHQKMEITYIAFQIINNKETTKIYPQTEMGIEILICIMCF